MTRNTRTLLGAKLLTAALFGAGGCHLIIGLDEFVDAPPAAEGCRSAADCPGGEHAAATCEAGVCGLACEEDYADCTEAPGCETATAADRANCGGCGVSCAAFCEAGECNDPVDIAAGPGSACAIVKDGSVWCWGLLPGPMALGEATPTPTRIDLPGPAVQVANASGIINPATREYRGSLCTLLVDGAVWCWGTNQSNQLGLGHTQPVPTPQNIGIAGIREISIAPNNGCAVTTDNRLTCWGSNETGLVGNGTTQPVMYPEAVLDSIEHVSIGPFHACAIRVDESIACWGADFAGSLGLGDNAPAVVTSPTDVGSWSGAKEVACGSWHTCARFSSGMACWGFNASGQLGLGDTSDRSTPQALSIAGPDSIALGWHHTGMVIDGEVFTWGDNSNRQLGTGDPFDASSPQRVSVADVQKLVLGAGFSCALTVAGQVLCWGGNAAGELGDGTTEARSTAAPVVWP